MVKINVHSNARVHFCRWHVPGTYSVSCSSYCRQLSEKYRVGPLINRSIPSGGEECELACPWIVVPVWLPCPVLYCYSFANFSHFRARRVLLFHSIAAAKNKQKGFASMFF